MEFKQMLLDACKKNQKINFNSKMVNFTTIIKTKEIIFKIHVHNVNFSRQNYCGSTLVMFRHLDFIHPH
jgi:hypothetical protein